jgi:Mg-chelatase subunit ChlD
LPATRPPPLTAHESQPSYRIGIHKALVREKIDKFSEERNVATLRHVLGLGKGIVGVLVRRRRPLQAAVAALLLLTLGATGGQAADSLKPSSLTLTLAAGSSWDTSQMLHLDATPAKADVVIAVDTTGSMGAAIADAKADAISIVNRIQSAIPGARFAVVDFKDYPFAPFGGGSDYPYLLRTGLTSNASVVQTAVNAMSAGGGGDLPESFNRVFFEAYSDTSLAYDANAPRFLVVLADDIPHDTTQNTTFSACPNTSPTDPGRDATVGTSDDLRTKATLDGLKANNTNVSFVTYNPGLGTPGTTECHAQMALYTGGQQVTHGATDSLADEMVALIRQAAARVDRVDLTVEPESFASWVSFDPPQPYGPFNTPRDVPYEMTVRVPPETEPGTYTFTVRADADGATRATQTVTVQVRELAASALSLTVGERSSGAGIASLPFSSIPASRIPFLGGSTSALPAGSIPAGSIPAGSIPAGSIPAGSIPAGSIPAGSIPAGSIPAGSIPAGSIAWGSYGLGSTPAGSIPAGSIAFRHVLLSQIPLLNAASGATWQQVLAPPSALNLCPAGSPPDRVPCRPLNALTFEDLVNDPVALGRLNNLPLKDVGLPTLWRGAPFAALLLGNGTLNQVPPPPGFTSWTTALEANGGSSVGVNPATNTVFGVYVAGQLGSTPAGSIPAGSIPYGSIPAGSIPAGSIPAGSIDITMTRIGAVPIAKLVPQAPKTLAAYVNCSGGFSCTGKTLGQADVAGAINPTLTMADLFAALPPGDADRDAARATTLDQLIMAMLSLTNYPWEEISVEGLQDVAQSPSQLHYHVDFDLDCSLATTFTTTVNLPDGFIPLLGSTRFTYGGGQPVVGRNPSANDGGDLVFTPDGTTPCGTGVRHVRMDFTAFAGLTLGDQTSDVSVSTATRTTSANDAAPVQVTENHEANDAPLTSPVIARNTLIVGHVSHAADEEHFRFPIGALPRHSKVIAFLNVPEGADYDLVVNKPFSPALQSNPAGSIPAGSIPVEDPGAFVDNANRNLPPETLADVPAGSIPAGSIPAGSIPAGSISATRGAESEAAQIVKAGETGDAIISISGYNGSHSAKPYVLRVQVIDPPPLPPCPPVTGLGAATPGTLPAASSLPADTKTLFLVNRQRLVGLYGATAADSLLAPGPTAPLTVVASRPEVKGAVIPVDGSAAVRTAYAAWDQNPCSVDAANEIVRRINDVIAGYRDALPQLRYIVLLGTDQAIPMYRQDDLTTLSPEIDEAADLAFTTNNLTAANALYAAAAQNTVPTDGAYGAFTKLTWLGHDLPLAQTPVSRLVETPAHMNGQLQQYIDAQGLLDPKSAVTMGYDFLTDGANDINGALGAQFPGITTDTLISPTGAPTQWNRNDFLSKSFAKTNAAGDPAVPDIISPNAHYSHWLAQPAGPSPISNIAQMVTSADVPGADKIAGRIVFNMGCHGGLNVPDNLPGDAARKKDWVDSYLQAKNAVYIANTGFGYGDTVTVALTERLLRLFGQKLNSAPTTIGEQWIDALQTYYLTAGDYDVFDEKAMIEATFYGLPFYRFRVPGSTNPPTPPTTSPENGLDVATLPPIAPNPTKHSLPDGRAYWDVARHTLNIPYRPVTPLLAREVTIPGKSARGIFIRSLRTHDEPNVKPLLAYPRIDSELKEPHPNFENSFWPANSVSLLRTQSLGEERASVVIKAAQFRPNAVGNPDLGTERIVDSIGLDVAYSGSTDTTAPRILQVGGVISGGGTTFFVRTTDAAGIGKVAVLYNDGTQADWQFRLLQNVSGDLWTVRVNGLTAPTSIIGEARDVNGNTGFGANKGVNHTSFIDTTQGPSILINPPTQGAVFTLNQQVTPDFACSDPGGVANCTGAPLVGGFLDTRTVGTHTFTVTATDLAGNVTTKTVTYSVRFAFAGFKPPVDNPPTVNVAKAGSTIPLKWSLQNAAGQFISDLDTVTSVSSEAIPCESGPADQIEETATEGLVALKYDAVANQFIYTWTTQKSWAGTCRRVFVAFSDGTERTADFKFK